MKAFFFYLILGVQIYAMTPQEALDRLMKGNERYMKDMLEHPNRTAERREATKSSQFPFAVIVGCSDSRVSPEILFDQGVGDLFVVRVAGNVIGPLELESVEYAVKMLESVLVIVLGHENCGAVKTVVDGRTEMIPALSLIIGPAVKDAKKHHPDHLLETAVKANALHMKDLLLRSGIVGKMASQKKIEIKAAYYDLKTGEVQLL